MYVPAASVTPGSSTGPLKVKKVRSSAVCAEAGAFPSPASSVPAQTSPQILLPTLLLSMINLPFVLASDVISPLRLYRPESLWINSVGRLRTSENATRRLRSLRRRHESACRTGHAFRHRDRQRRTARWLDQPWRRFRRSATTVHR